MKKRNWREDYAKLMGFASQEVNDFISEADAKIVVMAIETVDSCLPPGAKFRNLSPQVLAITSRVGGQVAMRRITEREAARTLDPRELDVHMTI